MACAATSPRAYMRPDVTDLVRRGRRSSCAAYQRAGASACCASAPSIAQTAGRRRRTAAEITHSSPPTHKKCRVKDEKLHRDMRFMRKLREIGSSARSAARRRMCKCRAHDHVSVSCPGHCAGGARRRTPPPTTTTLWLTEQPHKTNKNLHKAAAEQAPNATLLSST